MRKIKLTTFLLLTFFILNNITVLAHTADSNEVVIRKISSSTTDLYHEKDSVVEVFNYSNKTIYLTESDIYLMSQIVYAESKGEPYEGKVAVASVILNRLIDPTFPDTIEGVVKQANAFSCVCNGSINVVPDEISRKAVIDAIKGSDPTARAVFFYNPEISTCTWMKNVEKKNVKTIGHHVFFQIKR